MPKKAAELPGFSSLVRGRSKACLIPEGVFPSFEMFLPIYWGIADCHKLFSLHIISIS